MAVAAPTSQSELSAGIAAFNAGPNGNAAPAVKGSGAVPVGTPAAQIKAGQTFTDTSGNTGVAKFDPTTGKAFAPTVLSSTNIDTKNQQNLSTAASTSPSGQSIGSTGFVHNADQSIANAPLDATQTTDPGTGATLWQKDGLTYGLGPSAGGSSYLGDVDDPGSAAYALGKLDDAKASWDATGAAQLGNIADQYKSLVQEQGQVNAGANASAYTLLARGGSLQTGSSSGIIQAQISFGIGKIASLVAQQNSATIQAQQAIEDGDMKLLDEKLTIAQKARGDAQAAASKLEATITAQRQQVAKDNAVSDALSNGHTSVGDILSYLKSTGNTSMTSADVNATLNNLNPDAKNIMGLMQTATENGAPASVLKAIGAAKSYTDAINAGAGWTSSNAQVQEYNMYKGAAMAKGQTPVSFDSWVNTQKYNEAYATSKGTEAGKNAATPDAGSLMTTPKTKADIPTTLQPYSHQSANGTFYLDLSGVSPTQADKYAQMVGGAMPVIHDKAEAEQLVNITSTNKKLDDLAKIYADISQPDALARDLGGLGITYSASLLQTNPALAADEASKVLKASIFSSISGIGTTGRAAQLMQSVGLPSVYNTQDDNATLINTYKQFLDDNENSVLGTNTPTNNIVIRSEQQSQDALTKAGKDNPQMQTQITTILNATNPDTGQPYTYTEASQILGINVPGSTTSGVGSAGQSLDRSPFAKGGFISNVFQNL